MAAFFRNIGAIESTSAIASISEADGAYMDTDGANARFGACGPAASNRGLILRTLSGGAALAVLTFTAAGAATFAGPVTTGNIGIGTVPSPTVAGFSYLALGGLATMFAEQSLTTGVGSLSFSQNALWTGTAWKYLSTGGGPASNFYMSGGTHVFRTASTGAGGAALTWTTLATLASSGMTLNTGLTITAGTLAVQALTANGLTTVSAGLLINGAIGAIVPGAIYKEAAGGLKIIGIVGSANDVVIASGAGLAVMTVPTGTQTAAFLGKINATALPTSASGLVAGDLWNSAGVIHIV